MIKKLSSENYLVVGVKMWLSCRTFTSTMASIRTLGGEDSGEVAVADTEVAVAKGDVILILRSG